MKEFKVFSGGEFPREMSILTPKNFTHLKKFYQSSPPLFEGGGLTWYTTRRWNRISTYKPFKKVSKK